MEKVILIGYFNEVAELCEKCGCEVIGVVDSKAAGAYPYLGSDNDFIEKKLKYIDVPLVITPDTPEVREKLFERYSKEGFHFKTLIANDAVISKTAEIAEGCIIQSLCNVSANTVLEKGVRINTGANIMHDVYVSNYSVAAPNAVVLGYASIGAKAYIGANATILPSLRIGDNSIVGAGAVVTGDIECGSVVAGVPARVIKYRR